MDEPDCFILSLAKSTRKLLYINFLHNQINGFISKKTPNLKRFKFGVYVIISYLCTNNRFN